MKKKKPTRSGKKNKTDQGEGIRRGTCARKEKRKKLVVVGKRIEGFGF